MQFVVWVLRQVLIRVSVATRTHSVAPSCTDSLEGHLNQVGEDVLGVERDTVQVSVLLDEVEQFRGVGHPEGQRSRDVLLLLQGINRRHATEGGGGR